jgi:tetratricopeptide (TPR) repeat protein
MRASMKRSLAFLMLSLAAVQISAETKVGAILSVSGAVTMDPFGKRAPIAPVKGDLLYASTILKTGTDGRAMIELQGATREIPPGTTVKIADLLSTGVKNRGLAPFELAGRVLRSFSAAWGQKATEKVLGTKANKTEQASDEPSWEDGETDAATILAKARESIEAEMYDAALRELAAADRPSDPALARDLLFWKGFCNFQLENYSEAAASLSAANSLSSSSKSTVSTSADRGTLLFQLASSYYLLGQGKSAIPPLDAYLAENPDGPYAPYATVLLAKALDATGDISRARAVAADGAGRYKGSDLEKEFASIAK